MSFRGGTNIAMKIPSGEWSQTVAFYRDSLGLEVLDSLPESVVFQFGSQRLWIDLCSKLAHAEVWLEVIVDSFDDTAKALSVGGIERCDEVEPLPPGFRGFWIRNPAGLVHLVVEE